MTAVLSQISNFDYFLNIVISDLWVNCKKFELFVEVWGWVKILFFHDRGP